MKNFHLILVLIIFSACNGGGEGTPSSRSDNTAVWTGVEMIIWGGINYSTNEYKHSGEN